MSCRSYRWKRSFLLRGKWQLGVRPLLFLRRAVASQGKDIPLAKLQGLRERTVGNSHWRRKPVTSSRIGQLSNYANNIALSEIRRREKNLYFADIRQAILSLDSWNTNRATLFGFWIRASIFETLQFDKYNLVHRLGICLHLSRHRVLLVREEADKEIRARYTQRRKENLRGRARGSQKVKSKKSERRDSITECAWKQWEKEVARIRSRVKARNASCLL